MKPGWAQLTRGKVQDVASFLSSFACVCLFCRLLLFLPPWFADRLKSLWDVFPFRVGKGKWNPFGHVVFLNFKASSRLFSQLFHTETLWGQAGRVPFYRWGNRLRRLILWAHLPTPASVSWVLPQGFSYFTVVVLASMAFDCPQSPPPLLQ